MKAYLNLRYAMTSRREMFERGLKRLGYTAAYGLPVEHDLKEGDILVTWNRVGIADKVAQLMTGNGHTVLVTENASWGNSFAGEDWLTLCRKYHNLQGTYSVYGDERWDSLNVELLPFKPEGETLLLPQRGIGPKKVAMPSDWLPKAQRKYGGTVRRHPGKNACTPLEKELKHYSKVVTWGSGAAIKALMLGCGVISELPNWIGEQDNTESSRLEMFRSLAWAQARHSEIESGDAFVRLL